MKKELPKNLTAFLLLLMLGLCLYGAVSGQAEDVFRKAATICMECIGLG